MLATRSIRHAPGRRQQWAAALHIVAGTCTVGLISGLWVCAALLAPIFEGSFVPGLVAMFGRPVAIALIGFGVLETGTALALLRGRSWARVMLLMVSALQLPVVPIGTALALCTAWALVSPGRNPRADTAQGPVIPES